MFSLFIRLFFSFCLPNRIFVYIKYDVNHGIIVKRDEKWKREREYIWAREWCLVCVRSTAHMLISPFSDFFRSLKSNYYTSMGFGWNVWPHVIHLNLIQFIRFFPVDLIVSFRLLLNRLDFFRFAVLCGISFGTKETNEYKEMKLNNKWFFRCSLLLRIDFFGSLTVCYQWIYDTHCSWESLTSFSKFTS